MEKKELNLEKKLVEKIEGLREKLMRAFDEYKKESSNFSTVRDYQIVFEAFVINRLGMIELALDMMNENTHKR